MGSDKSRLLRVPLAGLRPGRWNLDKEASHYLINVHRAVAGDRFLAFDVEAVTEAIATLVQVDAREAICSVDCLEASTSLPKHRLVLIQAFGKGTKIDQVVRDATALDATEIWVVSTSRSTLSSPQDIRGRLERWRKIAIQAARQCERGNIPNIQGALGFKDALNSLDGFVGQRWLLSPWANDALGEQMVGLPAQESVLLIGPEGGFDENEVACARDCGFRDVRVGYRVLRSETAVTAVLGALAALRDRSDPA